MIQRREDRDGSIITISGALDQDSLDSLQLHLNDVFESGRETVRFDLRDGTSINSASLGKLLLFRQRMDDAGRTVRIDGCSEALLRTFHLLGFHRLIEIAP